MSFFTFIFRNSKWLLIASVLAGLISGLCSARLIMLANRALNVTHSTEIYLFLALLILMFVAGALSMISLVILSQRCIYKLRILMCETILKCPLRHIEDLGTNKLFVTLTGDIQNVSQALLAIPVLCINCAILLGCFIYIGAFSLKIAEFLIIFIIGGILVYRVPLIKAINHLHTAREKEDVLFAHFQTIVDGVRELKLNKLRRDNFFKKDLEVTAMFNKNFNIKGMSLFSGAVALGQLLFFLMLGILLFIIPKLFRMDHEAFSGVIIGVIYMILPLTSIINTLSSFGRANVAYKKIQKIHSKIAAFSPKENFDSRAVALYSIFSISLSNVIYKYSSSNEDVFTLGPISMTLRPGEITFLVGGNGCGKSTTAKLITGLYAPEAGTVQLNDVVINDDNREWYHQHFSAIFSEFHLFDRLCFNENDINQELLTQYMEMLQLINKVKILDGKFSTLNLSKGQRKRLALLSAYLEDKPVYLFDEWAADQDPLYRKFFYTTLLSELKLKNKCIIVITHDEHYFHIADNIINMDYGKIATITRKKSTEDKLYVY